jgi:hypothetical protein
MTFAGIDIVLIARNVDETISIYDRSLGLPELFSLTVWVSTR